MLALIFLAQFAAAGLPDPSDIRTLAPYKPEATESIAQPQSGSDLGSISGDWAARQFHLMTNGADERFLKSANDQLANVFNTRAPASAGDSAQTAAAAVGSWYRPQSVRLPKVGQIEFGFAGRTTLGLDVNGEVNLTRPVFDGLDVRLHHETEKSLLQFQLNW